MRQWWGRIPSLEDPWCQSKLGGHCCGSSGHCCLIDGRRCLAQHVFSRDMDCAESVLEGFLFEVEEAGVGDALQGSIAEDFNEGFVIKGEQ